MSTVIERDRFRCNYVRTVLIAFAVNQIKR